MSRFFKYVLYCAIAVAGLAGLLVTALVTTSGQRLILAVASKAVATNDFRLTIGRLDGSLLNRGRIERIAVSDRHGAWLLLEDVRLTWSALSLLRHKSEIEELAIGKVPTHSTAGANRRNAFSIRQLSTADCTVPVAAIAHRSTSTWQTTAWSCGTLPD